MFSLVSMELLKGFGESLQVFGLTLLFYMMVDAYAQIGMNVESIEKGTVTFLGEERTALLTKGDVQGAPYWQVQVFDYHLGQYNVTLTVSSYLEDKTADVLNLFYPVQ